MNEKEKNEQFLDIDYAELRRKYLNSFYPKSEFQQFNTTLWSEETETFYSVGANWYDHVSKNADGSVPHLFHKINSDLRHGNNFYNNPDIIAGGCSVTAGVGLPHNFLWPEIISHITNQKVNNTATNAASISKIVYNVLSNMQKFGVPKKIYLLLPELSRGWISIKHSHEDWGYRDITYSPQEKQYVMLGPNKIKAYVHQSFDSNKTLIPLDLIVNENLRAVDHLAMICKTLNIELKIYSWDSDTLSAFKSLGYKQVVTFMSHHINKAPMPPSHVPGLGGYGWHKDTQPFGYGHCCKLEPLNKYQRIMWQSALDFKNDDTKGSHPGLHSHIHVAELFTQTKIKPEDYADISPWYSNTSLDSLIL